MLTITKITKESLLAIAQRFTYSFQKHVHSTLLLCFPFLTKFVTKAKCNDKPCKAHNCSQSNKFKPTSFPYKEQQKRNQKGVTN